MNGQAIRTGQENGEIATKGNRNSYGNQHGSGQGRDETLSSPSDFLPNGNDRAQTYAMTDGVSDEQFDEALDRAHVYAELAELIAAHRFGEARDLMHQLLEERDQ